MKKFLFKTSLLIFPIVICLITLESVLRHIPNSYKLKSSYLNQNSNNIETLILGSSHSFFGVDPKYFSNNTFNAANFSQTLDYDYEVLMKYKDNFDNLKTIYIPISYFTLWAKLENEIESWRTKNYTLYYGMNSQNLQDYSEVLSNKFSNSIKKALKYILKNKTDSNCTKLGWGMNYRSENSLDLEETGLVALSSTIDNIKSEKYRKLFAENKLIIKKILEWSEQKDINVILVTLPAFASYRKNLNKVQLETTIETSNQIASSFDNCIYINLMDDSSFVANDYYDADHMSEIGAEKLSKKLNNLNTFDK